MDSVDSSDSICHTKRILRLGETMHPLGRYCIGIVIISCALIGACTRPPDSVGPTFKGRLLLLAGENTNGADLVELTAGQAALTYNHSIITSGVFEAAASPDRTRLLYTTKDGILLRDLRTGAVRPITNGENYCLAWSPDGNRFSYKQKSATGTAGPKLYFSDLEGKAKLIWEDLVAEDGTLRSLAQSRGGSSGCGHWIAPDRLIFDRFVGGSIKPQKTGEVLKPNTTTLAILSNQVKLSDTERRWSIESVCQAGSVALLRPHDQAQPILIAKNLDNLKTLDPSPAPCSGCRFVGFAAQSCVPFLIEDTTSTHSELFSLNPINWQRQRGARIEQVFSETAQMLINSSARLMIVGDAPATFLLVDTESGETVPFFPKSAGPTALLSPRPVVWIEN
jgi:WD40 repeat protein